VRAYAWVGGCVRERVFLYVRQRGLCVYVRECVTVSVRVCVCERKRERERERERERGVCEGACV